MGSYDQGSIERAAETFSQELYNDPYGQAGRQYEDSQDKPKSSKPLTKTLAGWLTQEERMEALDKATRSVEELEMENTNKEGTNQDIFKTLNAVNVNVFKDKKGKFDFLSWPWAVTELLRHHPRATWEVKRFDGIPFLKTDIGYFVEVEVDIDGIKRSQIHPVLGTRNEPLGVVDVSKEPTSFDINTSIQRCLVKAIGMHGLALYLYAGEDLPIEEPNYRSQYYQLLIVEHGNQESIPDNIIEEAKGLSIEELREKLTALEKKLGMKVVN